MSQEGTRIEGRIAIWFNPNSMFSIEFNKVHIRDAIGFIDIIRNVLKDTVEVTGGETEEKASGAKELDNEI